jgi:hypothetical protein
MKVIVKAFRVKVVEPLHPRTPRQHEANLGSPG